MFALNERLRNTELVSYITDPSFKWLAVTGLFQEVSGLPILPTNNREDSNLYFLFWSSVVCALRKSLRIEKVALVPVGHTRLPEGFAKNCLYAHTHTHACKDL